MACNCSPCSSTTRGEAIDLHPLHLPSMNVHVVSTSTVSNCKVIFSAITGITVQWAHLFGLFPVLWTAVSDSTVCLFRIFAVSSIKAVWTSFSPSTIMTCLIDCHCLKRFSIFVQWTALFHHAMHWTTLWPLFSVSSWSKSGRSRVTSTAIMMFVHQPDAVTTMLSDWTLSMWWQPSWVCSVVSWSFYVFSVQSLWAWWMPWFVFGEHAVKEEAIQKSQLQSKVVGRERDSASLWLFVSSSDVHFVHRYWTADRFCASASQSDADDHESVPKRKFN